MKKLDKILDNVMRFLMAVAMFALLAGGTWQIFTRWILRNPSTVTDEFLRYVLIWASMIGSAYCFYKDKHLALDLVKGRAKGAFNVILSVFIEAAIVFFVGYVFVYGGWKLTANATNVSSVMRIPFKLLYSILPISGIFIILARVLKYVDLFLESKNNGCTGYVTAVRLFLCDAAGRCAYLCRHRHCIHLYGPVQHGPRNFCPDCSPALLLRH